jgi:hypothetical protein
MKATGLIAVLALVYSLALGFVVDSEDVAPRPKSLTVAVGPSWYESLPIEPTQATNAYLARVTEEARARGIAVAETRFPIFWLRVGIFIASIALILFSGFSARMRDLGQRITNTRPLQDAIYALQFFAVMFLLDLPVMTYAGFVRSRRFGFSDTSFTA